MKLTKDVVIIRLCSLASRVGDKVFHNKEPYDCFCETKGEFFQQFSSEVIEFIENAVCEKIGLPDYTALVGEPVDCVFDKNVIDYLVGVTPEGEYIARSGNTYKSVAPRKNFPILFTMFGTSDKMLKFVTRAKAAGFDVEVNEHYAVVFR